MKEMYKELVKLAELRKQLEEEKSRLESLMRTIKPFEEKVAQLSKEERACYEGIREMARQLYNEGAFKKNPFVTIDFIKEVEITDEDAAISWLLELAPEAVDIKIIKGEVKKLITDGEEVPGAKIVNQPRVSVRNLDSILNFLFEGRNSELES